MRGELIEYIVLVVAQLDVARPGPCLSVYPSSCACPSVEASGVPFDDNFSSSQKKTRGNGKPIHKFKWKFMCQHWIVIG